MRPTLTATLPDAGLTRCGACHRIATECVCSVPPAPSAPTVDNPKRAAGADKLPLSAFPLVAIAHGALAMLEGELKYGRSNYLVGGVSARTYIDAALRHLFAYASGQDIDPDSGLPHLGKLLACIAILLDAEAAGVLTDDRPYPGGYLALVERLTPEVERLRRQYQGREAKGFVIGDGGKR